MITSSMEWEIVKNPLSVGAICSSSRTVAVGISTGVTRSPSRRIVEICAGTVVFTSRILDRRHGQRVLHVFETNETLWRTLDDRFSAVAHIHHDPADQLNEYAGSEIDLVISVAAGEQHYQFSYLTTKWANPARRRLAELNEHFADVVVSRPVWRNLPPAEVIIASNPRSRAGPERELDNAA